MEVQELLAKYFSGNVSSEERSTVESWREESAEHELEFIEFKHAWSLSNVERFNAPSAFSKIESKLDVSEKPLAKSRSLTSTILRVAAVITLIAAASYVVYLNIQPSVSEEVVADNKIDATLPVAKEELLLDGSKIVLGIGAKVETLTDFNTADTREVRLTGKGYFDIARDESKPFIIYTENARVEVLGTSFVVDNSSDKTQITVESGLVSISRNDNPGSVQLNPGEVGLIRDSAAGIVKHKNDNDNYLAWKTGVLYFKDTNLEEVASLLNEVYGMNVKFDNPSVKSCKITATFNNRDGSEILEIVGRTFNLEIVQEGNKSTIKGAGC
ncbi:MAG: FecR domain-containing protein [bacterium]|nr:FecR domain-containing protein [bacterium]